MTSTSIIGLGAMGSGMATNMLQAKIPLRGYDTDPKNLAAFARAGGTPTKNPAEAATDAKLLILMLVDADQINAVLFGEGNAAATLPNNAVVMISSTISAAEIRAIAAKNAQHGILTLDAPVSGGKAGADAGTLTVMASGPDAAFAAAERALDAIASATHRLGDAPGLGATYKVVHQLAAGVHLVVAAELVTLGVKAGCDPNILLDIVSRSAGRSWMLSDRAPRILERDFAPRSRVDIFVKDLGLVLETGAAAGVSLPLAAAAHRMLVSASEMGFGEEDDAAVVKAYEALFETSSKEE